MLARAVGAEAVVKHESQTPTGAFTVRGRMVYLDRLVRERPQVAGVVSATRGNHGQSIGVVSAAADATARSFEAGYAVNTDSAATFVDGVATRSPDPAAIAIICAGASRIVRVSEDATAAAMRTLLDTTRQLPEPAGAIALAGLAEDAPGGRSAIVMSGGNCDTPMLAEILAGRTPKP